MFRKPNRNLRVRRAESSGEEEVEEGERSQVERPKRPGGRGLTCGTKKKKEEADIEKTDTGDAVGAPSGTGGLLSFTEERAGEEATFQIKKPSVNAVIFKVQKKTENVEVPSRSPENDSQGGSHSEQEHSEPEDLECVKEEGSVESASTSTSPSASPSPPSQAVEIPDAKQIQAARRRRNRAQTKGDFLSLNASHEASNSSQSESDNELDDHERRIKFAPGMKTLNEQMAEEMASGSDSGSENQEDDDSQKRWEELQIRKAVKCPQAIRELVLRGGSPPRVKRHVEPKLPLVTMVDVKKKLTTRITSIQEVHRSHLLDCEKYTHDLENSKNVLEKLETSSGEQSFTFFKKMKIYVENFVDCLNEKILQINELEAEMFQILEERAKILLKRRQDDLRNESAAVQKLFGNGVTSDVETSDDKVENQIQDCELRRRKRRQRRAESGEEDHCEGMSSDDELPTDLENNLQRSRENILGQCRTIFDDVHEDFCRVKNVLRKFNEWRLKFPESYYDAYISLCLHKILNPLVRLQLIGWNPLEDVTELDQMPWYCDTEEFCFTKEEHENNIEENADHKVLSAVIEKTVVPRVSGFIEHVWDPLSSQQTERLVCFCKTYVLENESSKTVKDLIACLDSRLRKAIEDDIYIPLYPKRVLEDRNSPHSKFRERQFWLAVKLLGNVTRWDGFLGEGTLQELSLDKLLNRYLLLVLLNAEPNSAMVTMCSKIVECLPQSWFKGIEGGSSLAKLANFCRHLEQCVSALHKHNDRESMEKLTSLLMKIKAQNAAEEILKKYNLILRTAT
ncbi:PREDICTED: GC-rich sequence DNA-binding factor 2 [Nanorana parkeri]|uniref:GC-rich sequence DNA-binding factor 2 n=1 Tax=Nanorana parkeri TaxID=125878 RepID=UPI000854ADA4|nr:PREDICTED: GC-rich sequence DNA-binding factor 2 [Nanorana parkeri]